MSEERTVSVGTLRLKVKRLVIEPEQLMIVKPVTQIVVKTSREEGEEEELE